MYEKNYAGAINNMVCGNEKKIFGYSYGNVIELFQTKNDSVLYSISKFKNEVTALNIREDGNIVINFCFN